MPATLSISEAAPDTRQAILDAAMPLFVQQGFSNTSVRSISQAARANVALINYYFGTKEGLYLEVLRQLAAHELSAHPLPLLDWERATPEQLRGAMKVFVHTAFARFVDASGRAPLGTLLMRELADPTAALDRLAQEVAAGQLSVLRAYVGQVIGLPADDDRCFRAAFSIVGQVMFYSFARPLVDRVAPSLVLDAQAIEAAIAHIETFAWGGLMQLKEQWATEPHMGPEAGAAGRSAR
jgi:TetR/AcrR family transcriptional regulator, regulator of cefoperazone and chloramphenicol sensitivity